MRLLICTKQLFVSDILGMYIQTKGYDYDIARTIDDFQRMILQYKRERYELCVVDYVLYDHTEFNLYKFFQDNEVNVPLFFFNDPYVSHSIRVEYSQKKNRLYLSEFISDSQLINIKELMDIVLDFLLEPERRKYINLMTDILPSDATTYYTNFDLREFRKKYDMKVSRYSLLKFFYYRMDMIVGYADICKYLW